MENNRDTALSGEMAAERLGVSRQAVWKAVRALEREGHGILSAPGRGYQLKEDSGRLSVQGILPYLNDAAYARGVQIHRELESNNKTAKELAVAGHGHGTVVIADSQTAGRGRLGRPFASPPGGGLYISFLLSPERLNLRNPTWITAVAALAVCDAVKLVTGRDAGIKWVNDVFLDGKKICGILTEAMTGLESGGIEWLVVGIGINVTSGGLPPELRGIAAGLYGETAPGSARGRLAASLINTFLAPELWPETRELHAAYRARQILLGREVSVLAPDGTSYPARAVGLDADGRLLVRTPDGETRALSAGEVSVRPGDGGDSL